MIVNHSITGGKQMSSIVQIGTEQCSRASFSFHHILLLTKSSVTATSACISLLRQDIVAHTRPGPD